MGPASIQPAAGPGLGQHGLTPLGPPKRICRALPRGTGEGSSAGTHPTPAPIEGNDTAAAAERVLPCFLSSSREVLTAVPRFLPPAMLLSPCCPAFALGTRARRKESPDARTQKLPETKSPPSPLPQGLLAAAGCPSPWLCPAKGCSERSSPSEAPGFHRAPVSRRFLSVTCRRCLPESPASHHLPL